MTNTLANQVLAISATLALGAAGCGSAHEASSPLSQQEHDAGDATSEFDVGSEERPDSLIAPFDAALPVEVVDGGVECGAQPIPSAHFLVRTCCGGDPCDGLCVIDVDDPLPHCWCAGLAGGCPAGWLCCGSGSTTCVSDPGACYTGPPP